MTFPSHSMAHNHDTPELNCLIDLPITATTSTYSKFQQLINQVKPLTCVGHSGAKLGFATSSSLNTRGSPTL